MRSKTDMAIAPYMRTDRRPTRSIVKYSGKQPRAYMVLRMPESKETSDGRAPTPDRMTLPTFQSVQRSYDKTQSELL